LSSLKPTQAPSDSSQADQESSDPTVSPSAADPLSDTAVMSETDLEHSDALSVKSAEPPLKIPGYEQESFLGRGAFGEVWKAVDSNSGRLGRD
jgi:hypothetical protein